jgi:DNA-binding transcriptional MerR regulator
MEKTADAFRTISEVAEDLDLPQHVLRFWETRFSQIRPLKRGGGRRYYRREDINLLRAIRQLLYGEGYTIKGVQKILKEQGARGVVSAWRGGTDMISADEMPVDISLGSEHTEIARHAPPSAANKLDFVLEDDEPAAGRQDNPDGALGTSGYKILKSLLAELNECERLLGNARRPSSPH